MIGLEIPHNCAKEGLSLINVYDGVLDNKIKMFCVAIIKKRTLYRKPINSLTHFDVLNIHKIRVNITFESNRCQKK